MKKRGLISEQAAQKAWAVTMAKSPKSVTALVYDYGQYIELAVTLSKQFGRVLYYAPWLDGGNPTSQALLVGEGFDGVERVSEIWPHLDDIDLVVFPDVYQAELQDYLIDHGKRVWGSRQGEELELDRVKSKKLCKKLGIDIGPYEVVNGIDALREHLQDHDDQFVKVSRFRGNFETFHAPDYERIEPRLDELEHKLGAEKKHTEFICEDAINGATEVGYDGYTIDGKFPKAALIGVEAKDMAYVGRTMPYSALPEQVQAVNDKLAPALKRYGYRGFLSTELRCKGDKAYLIDPCCRCGSPPSELQQVMIENLGEILWEGAAGTMVEPKYRAKCGAMVFLLSDWASDNWQHVWFPSSIRDRVKLHNATMIDGEYYVIPRNDRRSHIGAVVGLGDSEEAAIEDCKRIAKKVEGYQIEKPCEALEKAAKAMDAFLGPQKPRTPLERKAGHMMRSGKISQKQYDRMVIDG